MPMRKLSSVAGTVPRASPGAAPRVDLGALCPRPSTTAPLRFVAQCAVGVVLLVVCSGFVPAAPIAAAQATSSAAAPQETAPQKGATAEPRAADERVEPILITVTATREPRPPSDVPAAVTIIRRSEIERSPA